MREDVTGARSSTVFVSYSREDADWVRRFRVMLQPVVANQGLDLWVDDRIAPGDRWRPELESAIARTRLALLLVSPDFLASRFIMDTRAAGVEGGGGPAGAGAGAALTRRSRRESRWVRPRSCDQYRVTAATGTVVFAGYQARGTRRDARIVHVCNQLAHCTSRSNGTCCHRLATRVFLAGAVTGSARSPSTTICCCRSRTSPRSTGNRR